jgi:hypothetical protein
MVHSIGGLWDSTETREAYSSRSSRAWAAEARSYWPPPGSAFRRCAEVLMALVLEEVLRASIA